MEDIMLFHRISVKHNFKFHFYAIKIFYIIQTFGNLSVRCESSFFANEINLGKLHISLILMRFIYQACVGNFPLHDFKK